MIRRLFSSRPCRGAHARPASTRVGRRPLAALAIVSVVVFTLSGVAAAYWTLAATGSGHALAKTLVAPTAPSTTGTTTSSISLHWTASGNPATTGYVVYRCTGVGCTPTTSTTITTGGCASSIASPLTFLTATPTPPHCTDTGLAPDTPYGYRVAAAYHKWVSPLSGTLLTSTTPAPTGAGTMTVTPTSVTASSATTLTFTYTATGGALTKGIVTLTVPASWPAPTTSTTTAGYTTASAGTRTVTGHTITVSNLTLAATGTFTIVYGAAGHTVTAPSAGTYPFATKEAATTTGTPTTLATQPSVEVVPATGSGSMVVSPTIVTKSSTTNVLTFTYRPAPGGTSNGTVTVTVPTTWTNPSTSSLTAGYTTATGGSGTDTVTITATHTIKVTGVTLTSSQTLTITYGAAGNTVTAPSTVGGSTFTAKQAADTLGTPAALATSPRVTVQEIISTCGTTAQTFSIPAKRHYAFTILGAGGGNGSNGTGTGTGGAGAAGASESGALVNTTTTPVTVSALIGCAGKVGTTAAGGAGGTAGFAAGGKGGNRKGHGGGGGGGGASTSLKVGATLVAEAGGGGGGGGAGNATGGTPGTTGTTTSTSTTAFAGGAGGTGSGANAGGGGGGGGGVTATAPGGAGGTTASGGGGTGGLNYRPSTGSATPLTNFTVTVTTPVVGNNPGGAGGSVILREGLPAFTSASSTVFTPTSSSNSFSVTATGAPKPTITHATFAGCTTSTLSGTNITFTSGGTDAGTATITGNLPAAGTYTLCLTATNDDGVVNQKFTLTVSASPVLVGVGPTQTWTSDTVTRPVTYPSGLASGDLLVFLMGHSHENLAACPATWTKKATVTTHTGTHASLLVCYRFWTGTATSVTVKAAKGTPNGPYIGVIAAFAHVTSTTPFDGAGVTSAGGVGTATYTPTGITTTSGHDLVLSVVDQDDGTKTKTTGPVLSLTSGATQTLALGFSAGATIGSTSGHQGNGLAFGHKAVPAAGAVTSPTWHSDTTVAGKSVWVGITLALKR